MTKPAKVTTLQDLADLAGVSRATASRALSDSPLISAKTKSRIRDLARSNNYRINERARDFRLKRTRVISVVFMLDVSSEQHMSEPFFLEMLGGIADTLAEHDYDLLLAHAPIPDVSELSESRVFRNSDGVIFVGQGEQHEQMNGLAAGDVPIVAWGSPLPDKAYCLVGGENETGGYLAADHLLKLGRRRIAFCGNTSGAPETVDRLAGYRRALGEHQVPFSDSLLIDLPGDMEGARNVFRALATSGLEFDGVVCASDVMALGAITAFTSAGISVPRDVSVVGYDDISLAAYSTPPLTTVRQNIRWAGRILVESVLGLIANEPVTDTTLKSELVVRESCGARLPGRN